MKDRKPRLGIDLRDGFADVYAFATLYEFLAENNFQGEIGVFSLESSLHEHFKKVVKNLPEDLIVNSFWARNTWPDILLKGYCDVQGYSEHVCNRDIFIDHSILKNCVKPLSEDERKELKQKYKVRDDLPVLVIGCPAKIDNSQIPALESIVKELKDRAIIYFVGYTSKCNNFCDVNPGIRIVESEGILKDYYAMADASIINKNVVWFPHDPMHNFVEATAGGPLFLIQPQHTQQYGYYKLINAGVIKESQNIEDLVVSLKKYLENPSGEARQLRAQHLEKSRNLYLNDILKLLNKVSGISEEQPSSDLKANLFKRWNCSLSKPRVYTPSMRIFHKDTVWNTFRKEILATVDIGRIPQEIYDKFWRGR